MAVNKYKPHIYVLPEDDANRQIANGFLLHESVDFRSIQVMPTTGGWTRACDTFVDEYVTVMKNNENTHVVLLIDFDDQNGRPDWVKTEVIPPELIARVFVIGARTTPEDLRRANLGTFEEIGRKLAEDCRRDSSMMWSHQLLAHNAGELVRLTAALGPILFPA
jgi:hypothetical protein